MMNDEVRVWMGRVALRQVAEPLLPSAASGCHLPRRGRLSYFTLVAARPLRGVTPAYVRVLRFSRKGFLRVEDP